LPPGQRRKLDYKFIGEPFIGRRERLAQLGALALLWPQAGEIHRGAKLEQLCQLSATVGSALFDSSIL
jgi:hypothetical protein